MGLPTYLPFAFVGSSTSPSSYFWWGNLVDSFYLGFVPTTPFVTFNGEGGTAVFLVGPPDSITFAPWDVTLARFWFWGAVVGMRRASQIVKPNTQA